MNLKRDLYVAALNEILERHEKPLDAISRDWVNEFKAIHEQLMKTDNWYIDTFACYRSGYFIMTKSQLDSKEATGLRAIFAPLTLHLETRKANQYMEGALRSLWPKAEKISIDRIQERQAKETAHLPKIKIG